MHSWVLEYVYFLFFRKVANRFFGKQDLGYLRAGIWDFKEGEGGWETRFVIEIMNGSQGLTNLRGEIGEI